MPNTYQRGRFFLWCAALLNFIFFWWTGRIFNIPIHPGYEASLLTQPAATTVFLITAIVLAASVLLGTLLAGSFRFDAGLFAATVGLTALSLHGGPITYVLMSASGPAVFLILAGELILLYGVIGLTWSGLWLLHRRGWLQGDAFRDGMEDVRDPLNMKLLATAAQVIVMLLSMLVLAQSDKKMQVLAAVGISAWLGTIASHALFPVRPSIWFWIGPMWVGLIGYLLAFASPEGFNLGYISGTYAALARPLPLDYAGIGTAAAIFGYWSSRQRMSLRDAQNNEQKTPSSQPAHE